MAKEQAENHFAGGMLSVLREHGIDPRFLMLTEYREQATQNSTKREVIFGLILNLASTVPIGTGFERMAWPLPLSPLIMNSSIETWLMVGRRRSTLDKPLRELVMASPGAEEPNTLQGLPLDLLRLAVEIYLGIAYSNAEPPPAVRRRLEWAPGLEPCELLSRAPFERVGKTPLDKLIYALRLGNARYPHMKMQIQPWEARQGFLLSVNTHDHALALDPNSADAAAFMALQAENQRLKVQIEQAWDEAGLPTFPRYLRDYLAEQKKSSEPDPST